MYEQKINLFKMVSSLCTEARERESGGVGTYKSIREILFYSVSEMYGQGTSFLYFVYSCSSGGGKTSL